MKGSVPPNRSVEVYLAELRKHLHSLRDGEADDIVKEIRSHILEKSRGEEIHAILTALGEPEDLAGRYVTDAPVGRSSLRAVLRWARACAAGLALLPLSLASTCVGGSLLLVALLKPFHPRAAGLWLLTGAPDDLSLSLRMGFGTPPQDGRELLGWWILPVGLALGTGLLLLTLQMGSTFARAIRMRENR
jgi:hypothetical protein